jgi:RecJ-like exonuclease
MSECLTCGGTGKMIDSWVVDVDDFGQEIYDDFEIECDQCIGKRQTPVTSTGEDSGYNGL